VAQKHTTKHEHKEVIITVSKRKLITSEKEPASNIQEVVVVTM
jgi:hypothetical protein